MRHEIGHGSRSTDGAPPSAALAVMKLSDLARDLPGAYLHGRDVEVLAVEDDSRRAGPGALFVAVRGRRSDGHAFLGDVLARGAAAAVVEQARPLAIPQL